LYVKAQTNKLYKCSLLLLPQWRHHDDQNIAPMTSSWRHIKTFIILVLVKVKNWSLFGKNWAKFKVLYSAHSQYWVNSIESLAFCKVECFLAWIPICQSRQKSAHWTVKFWVISSGKCCLFVKAQWAMILCQYIESASISTSKHFLDECFNLPYPCH